MSIDFDTNIREVRARRKYPFLVAHRGVCGANIPCNTLAAFNIAVAQGADVVELDVSKSKDGKLFVFHPGMESVYLQGGKSIADSYAEEVQNTPLLNCDNTPTSYRVPTLAEAFALLKGKVYINVDKYWTDMEGITEEIYRAGVQKQVIVKSFYDHAATEKLRSIAPELMYMQIARNRDDNYQALLDEKINYIGNEILFETESAPIVSDEYLRNVKKHGLLVWANAIVYNEKDVISAGRTDDVSLNKGFEYGWGWLADKGFDFIQTDWLSTLKTVLEK